MPSENSSSDIHAFRTLTIRYRGEQEVSSFMSRLVRRHSLVLVLFLVFAVLAASPVQACEDSKPAADKKYKDKSKSSRDALWSLKKARSSLDKAIKYAPESALPALKEARA
jgi:hypothetical protein